MAEIKTDEKKQHFDDIYVADTPVPYKVQILDALEYISDDFNREMFETHILPWAKTQNRTLNFIDLCSCFGNTTMATVYGMSYQQICENWKDETACQKTQGARLFDCNITAIDISEPALNYGKSAGHYDEIMHCNLNERDTEAFAHVNTAMDKADILLSTAALIYLDVESIEKILASFASGDGKGYVLVNFLNPFALEKSDEAKRILLKHLDFVGSRATRHRRLSPFEQENYAGEQWALLELWVLKRRSK
jgi:hypothetical protein